MFVDSSCLQR